MQGGMVELPFDNPLSAISYLERQGGTVLFADPLSPTIGNMVASFTQLSEQKVTAEELAESMNNIAVMLKAGIPLMAAVEDTMAANENTTIGKMGKDMMQRMNAGSTFSEAAGFWKRLLPDTALFLARIGEETGTLDRTMKKASEHILKLHRIYQDTKSALMYPAFMFSAIFLTISFWLYFVVPMMLDMFKAMETEIPPLTVAVLAASDFLQHHFLEMVIGIVVFILGFREGLRMNQRFRRHFHWLLLRIPIIRTIINGSNLAFITEYFSLLLNSGVDVMKSLEILNDSVSNEIYKEKLGVVRASLMQGNGLRTAFAAAEVFPTFVLRMIGVGEQSGTLSEQLDYTAEEYARQFSEVVKNIGKTIEPVALVIGGGLFVVMLAALFLPLYGMAK